MTLPNSPQAWANHLSKLLAQVHQIHGTDRFPVRVGEIAKEFSHQVFEKSPISLIKGDALGNKFEGMLLPNPNGNGHWGIIYNNAIKSKGRRNFTLAHEFGHYLLHRKIKPEGVKCTAEDLRDWRSEHGRIEAQANAFASFLLMPLDDFREEARGQRPEMELMKHLADRYEVSLQAVILKWLSMTTG